MQDNKIMDNCRGQIKLHIKVHMKGTFNCFCACKNLVYWNWSLNCRSELESVQNWKFCKMILFLARSRFEYCASWASPKKLARHWSLGPSLEMSPKFGKLASTSRCKWSIFKLIQYFFPFPCFIYLHLIQS